MAAPATEPAGETWEGRALSLNLVIPLSSGRQMEEAA
jgi:hypothetical protein